MMNDLAKAIRRWTEKNHDRRSIAFNVFVFRFLRAKSAATEEERRKKVFVFRFEHGQTAAPKMGVEICHRTRAIGRDLSRKSIWNLEKTSLLQFCVNFSNNVVSMAKPARY